LFAIGCPEPADLQNAQMYDPPPNSNPTGATGGSGGSGAMTNCETACLKAIITATGTGCGTCHSASVKLDMGTLDMASPNLGMRLKDQASAHKGLTDTSACPMGDKIIDSANPMNSWLLKKVKGQQGGCGTPMPTGGTLSAADQKCFEDFVACVTGGSAMPSGGSGSTGGTAAASGGSGGTAAGGTATGGSGGTGGA
jgi:hypothetical protein